MFNTLSATDLRQSFADVFANRHKTNVLDADEKRILDTVLMHPEYHELLSSPDLAEAMDLSNPNSHNPFLHMGLHIAIQEQISVNLPTGIRPIYDSLCIKYGDVHDAEHAMIERLAEQLWQLQYDQKPFDEPAYMEALRALTF